MTEFLNLPLEIRAVLRRAYFQPEKATPEDMDTLREYILTNVREQANGSFAAKLLKVRR